jgi:hypothetical protein
VRGRTATGMVVKRKTRNEGNTHHKLVVPRVQPLLKCAPSCRVRTPFGDGWRSEGPPTERSLHVYDSQHDRITELVSINSSPSHTSSSQSPQLAPVRPTPQRELASHSCEAGRSQGHPHIFIRPSASSCHLLQSLHTAQPPFNRLRSHITRVDEQQPAQNTQQSVMSYPSIPSKLYQVGCRRIRRRRC